MYFGINIFSIFLVFGFKILLFILNMVFLLKVICLLDLFILIGILFFLKVFLIEVLIFLVKFCLIEFEIFFELNKIRIIIINIVDNKFVNVG